MLSPALADYLSDRRSSCNARFAAARSRSHRLSPEEFSQFLSDQLSPLATALAEVAAKAGSTTLLALDNAYDIGLQLVAEKLAGPSAIDASVNTLWTGLFPRLAPHILKSPRLVIGSLINIRHHVAKANNNQANLWQQRLAALAPHCESPSHLLDAAKILAWRSGLPQFRASALELAATLPPQLALLALDAPPQEDLADTIAQHRRDPWFGYSNELFPISRSQLTRRIGAFRGFGGLFLSPPTVAVSGQQILVRSAEESWIVLADAFGANLLPAAKSEIEQAKSAQPKSDYSSLLPAGQKLASAVEIDGCFAITSQQSHSVWVGPTLDR